MSRYLQKQKEKLAHEILKSIVMNQNILKDLRKLNKAMHTGPLKSHHSLFDKYCTKRQHISHDGMMARTQLVAKGHNLNLGKI